MKAIGAMKTIETVNGLLNGIVWGWPAFWVYMCLHADWVIKSVWCTFRLLKGKWVHNTLKRS